MQQMPMLMSLVWQGFKPVIYHTQSQHTKHYNTDVFYNRYSCLEYNK
jgi:hypothetical protein